MIPVRIDKGIPVPPVYGERRSKYPWRDMKVGDSFYADGKRPSDMSGMKRYFESQLKVKFTARTERSGGKVGTRIWRTK